MTSALFWSITQAMSFELEAGHNRIWGQCKTLRMVRITTGMLSVMILEMILLLRGKQAASLRAWEIWLTSVTKVRALYHANKIPRYFLSIVYHIVVASELAGFTILIHDLSNSSDCNLHPRAQFFGLILFGWVGSSRNHCYETNWQDWCRISGGVFQIMNLSMTVAKLAFQKPRTPLMVILLREAVYTFLVLSGTYLIFLTTQALFDIFSCNFCPACQSGLQ